MTPTQRRFMQAQQRYRETALHPAVELMEAAHEMVAQALQRATAAENELLVVGVLRARIVELEDELAGVRAGAERGDRE